MNVLLIGSGDIANTYYSPSLCRLQQEGLVDDVFVSDIDMGKSGKLAHDYGFQVFDRKCIESVGAILITASYEAIKDIAADYSQYGIAMMMEKPPALSLSDLSRLRDIIEGRNILHQVAFNRHYMPVTVRLREELKEKGLDEIISVQTVMNRYRRHETTFYTTAIHDIDLVRYLSSSRFSGVDISYSRNNNDFFIAYEMQNSSCGTSLFLTDSGMVRERADVTCQDWSFTISLPMYDTVDGCGFVRAYSGNRKVLDITMEETPPYVRNGIYGEIRSFLECVEEGKAPFESLSYASDSVAVMKAVKDRRRSILL